MSETGALILEISVIILTVAFFGALFGRYIYKKAKGLPTGECAYCHISGKKLVKQYHKCCCNKK